MDVQGDATSSATPTVGATTAPIKIPEFWSSDSELWFLTVESVFRKHRVTASLTKFDYVVAALSQSTAAVVRDILRSPPENQPYETLRTELIRRTTESEPRRLQQLLTAEQLGDRKPTELLRRMEQLLGGKAATMDASIMRELFLQRLPQQVRMVLTTETTDSILTLARKADDIMDVYSPNISSVHHETAQPRSHLPAPDNDYQRESPDLVAAYARMEKKIDDLSRDFQNMRRHSRRGTLRSEVTTANTRDNSEHQTTCSPGTSTNQRQCWYHSRYGNAARFCRQPCSQSGNGKGTH